MIWLRDWSQLWPAAYALLRLFCTWICVFSPKSHSNKCHVMIHQNFYLLIFKPLNIKLFVKYCRLSLCCSDHSKWRALFSTWRYPYFLWLLLSLWLRVLFFFFLNLVCGGGPDAEGADHRATTSWVSKPSLPYESVHPSCWHAAHFHSFIMCSRISHPRPLALTQYYITVSAEYFEFSWQLINLGQSFQTPSLTVWRKGNLVLSMEIQVVFRVS